MVWQPGETGPLSDSMKNLDPLKFSQLRQTNVTRCESAFHPVNDWSPTDWATAAAGELGEACNMIKKMRRGDEVSLTEIGYELADAITYIDLLAARLGIDLGAMVRAKFNIVSKRENCEVRIPSQEEAFDRWWQNTNGEFVSQFGVVHVPPVTLARAMWDSIQRAA
jgi:NTP pyrophosphatase (non-canonical NTP hydrolase)